MIATDAVATFDTGQVARLNQCSEGHIRNMVKRGEFPAPFKLGVLVRWDRATVLKWIADRSSSNTVQRGGKTVEVRG